MTDESYWAAKSGLDLASEAFDRVKNFYNELPKRIMYQRWAKARRVHYGLSGQEDPFDISRPGIAGDEGQLTSVRVNHAGALNRRSVGQVSQTVPDWDPVPTNSESESLAQAAFCRKLLPYYMDTRHVGAKLYDQALGASIDGEGVLEVAWDSNAGPPLPPIRDPAGNPVLDPTTGQPVPPDPNLPSRTNTGDLVFRVYAPIDLPCDLSRYDQEHEWRITRRWVNKWNVAAKYCGIDGSKNQDLFNKIVTVKPEALPMSSAPTDRLQWERQWSKDKSDLIPLYTLYHRKTEAIPQGKIAEFLSSDIMLYEGALPYSEVPLVSMCPGKILRTPYGESQLHHLLALQDMYDLLASSVASNNAALALHLIFMPEGMDFSGMELSEGFAILRGDGPSSGKPEVLNFNAPNDVALKFMEVILEAMRMIGGVSSTQMGAPPPNVRSGEFGALIAQFALEFNSAFQFSFQQAVAQTGNLIVSILKQYADQPIVAQIVGEANDYQRVEFTKAKLENIERVVVKSGNPAARTPQFNIAMASDLLSKNLVDAKTYVTLVRTGQLDVMVDDAQSDDMRIRRENEMLAKGVKPTMLITDPHVEEIKRHVNGVLSTPAARDNPQIVTVTMAHVMEHIQALKSVDPDLLQILGQPVLGLPMAPPGQGASPGGPPPAAHSPQPGKPNGAPPQPPPTKGPLPMPSNHPPPLPPNAPQQNGAR